MTPRPVPRTFECADCGSPSVALPAELKPDAVVSCGHCGRRLCNWGEFRDSIDAAVSRSGRRPVDLLAR